MLPQAPGMFVQVLGRLAMLSAQMDPEDLREVIAAYATISLQTKKIRGLHGPFIGCANSRSWWNDGPKQCCRKNMKRIG